MPKVRWTGATDRSESKLPEWFELTIYAHKEIKQKKPG